MLNFISWFEALPVAVPEAATSEDLESGPARAWAAAEPTGDPVRVAIHPFLQSVPSANIFHDVFRLGDGRGAHRVNLETTLK